jgi:hypothetical protein
MSYGLLSGLLGVKRKIFVSYHHGGDRGYYDAFINLFSSTYDVIDDNSVERAIDSSNTDYVIRNIRENYITGSSCTIVLCGAQTPDRKFVDWEIKATLDKGHGLIGVNLPTNPMSSSSKYAVPHRLYDNIETGYAIWTNWDAFVRSPQSVQQFIEMANAKSASLINNSRPLKQRNG